MDFYELQCAKTVYSNIFFVSLRIVTNFVKSSLPKIAKLRFLISKIND